MNVRKSHQVFPLAESTPLEAPLTEQAIYDLQNTLRKTNEFDYDDEQEEEEEEDYQETDPITTVDPWNLDAPAILDSSSNDLRSSCSNCFQFSRLFYLLAILAIQTKR